VPANQPLHLTAAASLAFEVHCLRGRRGRRAWFRRLGFSEGPAIDTFPDVLRWMVAVPLGLLFLLCSLGNWSLIIGALVGHLKRFSLVLPFIGPVFGILFFVAVPIDGLSWYWWLAPLIEPSWLLATWCVVTWPFAPRRSPGELESGPEVR